MSHSFKLSFLVLFALFILSCVRSASINQASEEDNSFQELRTNYKKEKCYQLKDQNLYRDCLKKCKEMYGRKEDRTKCKEMEIDLINDLFKTFKLLKTGDEDQLYDIDSELFEAYISINSDSIKALEKIIKSFSNHEAETFLFWLINDRETGLIFEKKDNEFNTLEQLFEEMYSSYKNTEIWKPLTERKDGEILMSLILDAGDEILDWIMNFINKKHPDCKNDIESKGCFEVYCRIGKRLDKDEKENWLQYERFAIYISKIIDEKVNSQNSRDFKNRNPKGWRHEDAPGRSSNDIGKLRDLKDWENQLCKSILISSISYKKMVEGVGFEPT